MAITNLAGTAWLINETPNLSTFPFKERLVGITFRSNGNNFKQIYVLDYANPLSKRISYYPVTGSSFTVYCVGEPVANWYRYRYIEITGGTYATNAKFITWLSDNAVQQFPKYRVSTEDMKVVADAIRTKGGTSEDLVFPNGFADAIAALQPPIPSDYGHITFDGSTITVS